MKLIITKNYNEMSAKATDILIDKIKKNPKRTICFATGKTMKGLYRNLVKSYKKGVDFSKIRAFNLDEYYPIKKSDKHSFYYYLFTNFFNKVNIKKSNITLLNGETKNPKKECKDYEKKIKKFPIDIVLLGVGINGHIAFNEPGSSFNSKTRLVNLLSESIEKRNLDKSLTIGIKTIMSAKMVIIMASGKKKFQAVNALLKGRLNKSYPISFLKKHKNLIVIVDKKSYK